MAKKARSPDKGKKQNVKQNKTDRHILTAVLVLSFLALCVAVYGLGTMTGGRLFGNGETETGEPDGETGGEESSAGGALIRKISIGEAYAEIVPGEEQGQYQIRAALPVTADLTRISCTLELAKGAQLSPDSNCIINELGGQLLLNLGVEDARLAVSDADEEQIYYIMLSIAE